MRRAAIIAPLRTATGAFGGALRAVPVEELGAIVARAVLAKTGIDPALIEDVIFAQSYTNGETPCTGRWESWWGRRSTRDGPLARGDDVWPGGGFR